MSENSPKEQQMSEQPLTPVALAEVLEALAGAAHTEAEQTLTQKADPEQVSLALGALQQRDPHRFQLMWGFEHRQMTIALLRKNLSKEMSVVFLFAEAGFVERHLKKLIQQYEGLACCADKSRWCLNALARHLVDEKPIIVDRTQEYTFHLPTRVLTTQEELLRAFDGLYRLYYGDVMPWLTFLAETKTRLLREEGDLADNGSDKANESKADES